MKLIGLYSFILTGLLSTGCSTRSSGGTTLFFKQEKPTRIVNVKTMEDCMQSGAVQLHKEDLTLIYYFRNCNIKIIRKLQEFELKQWGLKRKK